MQQERSPGMKLFVTGFIAAVLIVPLMMVYLLVYDRESQSEQAQNQITRGWGGPQAITGPVLVIPFMEEVVDTQEVNGQPRVSRRQERRDLFVSPTEQAVQTTIDPDRKAYAIYESVVYQGQISGTSSFALTDELERLEIEPAQLLLDQAELRFGVSDTRGLTDNATVTVDGEAKQLHPGNGPAATNGRGFSTSASWTGDKPLRVSWKYGLRGSRSLSLIPRGGITKWDVSSAWPHPSFTGFLPDQKEIASDHFTASYPGITNITLNRPLMATADEPSVVDQGAMMLEDAAYDRHGSGAVEVQADIATIGLTDPVDLYSQVDRAVKYGFLFIGFTFATFLMFDLVGGARVASAEYLLTGSGLVLFFVMLLAFAELWGFALAYVTAAAAIIGLLTAYSAAVLGTWKRAGFIGAMLAGLYALLFVLLGMETYSLVVGSLFLFLALAGIMFATRKIDWSSVGRAADEAEA